MEYNVSAKDNVNGNQQFVLYKKYPNTDADCLAAFVAEMNRKATAIGMTSSIFYNPSGLEKDGVSKSTARSLAILAAVACGYPELCDIWNKQSYTIHRKDASQISISTSVSSSALSSYYPILGGKTGSGAGYNTLIIVTEINGHLIAGAVMDATDQSSRFTAMKQLFDATKATMESGTVTPVADATKACSVYVPSCPRTYPGDKITAIYTQNADVQTGVQSVTKTLSVITALDYLTDINRSVKIVDLDVNGIAGSGAIFSAGNILSIKDLIYAMMLPSSNQAAQALGRIAGNEILKYQNFLML